MQGGRTMQGKALTGAGRIVLACAFLGTLACAASLSTSVPVSINSYPGNAKVEIKRLDGSREDGLRSRRKDGWRSQGIVIQEGVTPMTATLVEGKQYLVTISLDGYQTENVPILDLESRTIGVRLKRVMAQ